MFYTTTWHTRSQFRRADYFFQFRRQMGWPSWLFLFSVSICHLTEHIHADHWKYIIKKTGNERLHSFTQYVHALQIFIAWTLIAGTGSDRQWQYLWPEFPPSSNVIVKCNATWPHHLRMTIPVLLVVIIKWGTQIVKQESPCNLLPCSKMQSHWRSQQEVASPRLASRLVGR